MMPWWVLAVFVLGANFALWGTVGLIRLAESAAGRRRPGTATAPDPAGTGNGGSVMAVTAEGGPGDYLRPRHSLTPADVAVLIPAHNEAW